MRDREEKIQVDIDKDRIRDIVSEALRMIYEYFDYGFRYTKEEIIDHLDSILNSDMITTTFFLNVGCEKIPDLTLRVDPRRKKVLCKSKFRKKVAKINHFVKIL